MKNYIAPGEVVTLPAPAPGVSSGDVVQVGAFVGVAAYDAATGEDVEVALTGVFELPKGAEQINVGDRCYWDGSNVTAAADPSDVRIGVAAKTAATNDTTVRVRLDGITVQSFGSWAT